MFGLWGPDACRDRPEGELDLSPELRGSATPLVHPADPRVGAASLIAAPARDHTESRLENTVSTHPELSLKLSGVELLQREGHRITALDVGLLNVCRRSRDPELMQRAEAIEKLERARARKRAQAKRAGDLAAGE